MRILVLIIGVLTALFVIGVTGGALLELMGVNDAGVAARAVAPFSKI